MRNRFESGRTFNELLEAVRKNEALWKEVHARARIPDQVLKAVRELKGQWYLLALSEDWCGDAVNLLPFLARLAEQADNVDLRILSRDDNPDLMDTHLTGGRSRSIPVVMALDSHFQERGWWGPRPAPLQEWVVGEGLALESGPRYREIRRYYARDKGRTFLAEIVALLQAAERVDPTASRR